MRAISITAGLGLPLCLPAGLLCVTLASTADRPVVPEPTPPGAGQLDRPQDVCDTGCSAQSFTTGELREAEYLALLESWSAQAIESESVALDTLLFHGGDVLELESLHGTPGLDDAHRDYLLREVSREGVWISVRAVNEDGVERLMLEPTLIAMGEKQHLFPEHTLDVEPPEISGTVYRVGVRHLWTRL